MELQVSWVAVAVAVAVGLGIAWVWYSDWGLVGGRWRALTGITPEDSARAGRAPFIVLVVCVVATAVALTLASALAARVFASTSVWVALAVAGVAWLGLSLSTLAQHNGFEQKPARLTVINGAYQLVLFLGMSLAVGLLS